MHMIVHGVILITIIIPYSTYISRVFNLRISRIWSRSRNYFSENFDTSKLSHIGDVKAPHSRNYFNEIKKPSYSRKFRPAKYKRYTVVVQVLGYPVIQGQHNGRTKESDD